MGKPFLILQLRPEDETADNELVAFMKFGGLAEQEVRRIRMEKESVPANLDLSQYSGVIVGGGPYNVSDEETAKPAEQRRFEAELNRLLEQILAADFPYLGECYGLGFLAHHLGAPVSTEKYAKDVEATTITLTTAAAQDPLTKELPSDFRAFAGHKEAVQALPPSTELLASSAACPVHMIRYQQNVYGTQFHPELDPEGLALRIHFYKHKGYFDPADADQLIEAANREHVTIPEQILRRFVDRFRR